MKIWLIPTEHVTIRSSGRIVKTIATAVTYDDYYEHQCRVLIGGAKRRRLVDIPLDRLQPKSRKTINKHLPQLEEL